MENDSVPHGESSRNVPGTCTRTTQDTWVAAAFLATEVSASGASMQRCHNSPLWCCQPTYSQSPHKNTIVCTKVDYNMTGTNLCLPLKCLHRTLLWSNNETLYCKSNQFNKQKFVLHKSKWGIPQYLNYHLVLGLLLILPHEFFHVAQTWNLSFNDLGANRISRPKIQLAAHL